MRNEMKWIERIRFIKHCADKSNDARFVKYVNEIMGDWTLVNLVCYGEQISKKMIYHIAPDALQTGFFATHNRLLAFLYYADYYGLIPVVEYGKEYCYAEQCSINGTDNPFEYYFQQPTDITLKDLRQYRNVMKSRKENAALAGKLNKIPTSYGMSELFIEELAKITKKYIKLNEVTNEYLNKHINSVIGNEKTLGIHIRGTDFKKNYRGHPIAVPISDYLSEAKRLIEKNGYNQIFLATDDVEAINFFKQEFGGKLCYYHDVIRSDGEETVMKSTVTRENHHYLLGLEVLRDMCTLATCDGLLAGVSQVSYASLIQKKSTGTDFENIVILNKGINKKGRTCPV